MNETEELELNQWCHAFLGNDPALLDGTGLLPLDYTTDLNLAAIVEAKAIETAGDDRYDEELWRLTAQMHFGEYETQALGPLAMQEIIKIVNKRKATANAITRCRAARAAVEG